MKIINSVLKMVGIDKAVAHELDRPDPTDEELAELIKSNTLSLDDDISHTGLIRKTK